MDGAIYGAAADCDLIHDCNPIVVLHTRHRASEQIDYHVKTRQGTETTGRGTLGSASSTHFSHTGPNLPMCVLRVLYALLLRRTCM